MARQNCETTGKKKYPGLQSAKKAIKGIDGRGKKGSSGRMAAYRCKDCNYWHVGH